MNAELNMLSFYICSNNIMDHLYLCLIVRNQFAAFRLKFKAIVVTS